MFTRLASESLLSRKGSVILTCLAMTVSIFVLLGVEHIRQQSKESFANTVSGADLIVGARSGSVNLLLYSVFRIGSPTNNITWKSYESIVGKKSIDWAIPISLGDSHNGYRVIGTNLNYFQFYKYGAGRELKFLSGRPFDATLDVVLGYEVARKLGYKLGDQVVLAHGIGNTSFSLHDDKPFTVVGILEATGTPVDQSLHVSLRGIEAIHVDWKNGVKMPGVTISMDQVEAMDLRPKNITAVILGLKSKLTTFKVQRDINSFEKEPLMAILPGVALSELWQMMSVLEKTLRLVSALVLVSALLGLAAMLLASVRERSREIQLLRVIGARPSIIFILLEVEALMITLFSAVVAIISLYLLLVLIENFLISSFGLHISANVLSSESFEYIALVFLATLVVAVLPSFNAYKTAK